MVQEIVLKKKEAEALRKAGVGRYRVFKSGWADEYVCQKYRPNTRPGLGPWETLGKGPTVKEAVEAGAKKALEAYRNTVAAMKVPAYCPTCGEGVGRNADGEPLRCERCGHEEFRRRVARRSSGHHARYLPQAGDKRKPQA